MHGARTRRQTRQSEAHSTAAAESNTSATSGGSPTSTPTAAAKDDNTALKGYVPGASLSVPAVTRTGPETRSVTRLARANAPHPVAPTHDTARANASKNIRSIIQQVLFTLVRSKQLTEQRAKEILEGAQSYEASRALDYLKAEVGEEAVASVIQIMQMSSASNAQAKMRMQQNQGRQNAALLQQGALGGMEGAPRQGTYPMPGLVGQYGMGAAQLPRPPLTRQQLRTAPYGQGLPQQHSQRPEQTQFQQESLGFPSVQRTLAAPTGLAGKRAQLTGTGEVAKTLMPNRSEGQHFNYASGSYLPGAVPMFDAGLMGSDFHLRAQLSSDARTAATEGTSNKRAAAPVEAQAPKAARTKPRRAVEDPSAPDVGDMDAVTEAAISIETEQKALLTDIPKSVTDASGDNQLIESDILNVAVVKARLEQVIAEEGMRLAGTDCVDVVIQGMVEKFEAFMVKALKRAMHRSATAHVSNDSETVRVTSNVRSQLREIKKKQEQRKANKLREEREKLEQLAETASKKELASNKELAAKVEKVKREKQFNAEAEAANRALSNALGGFGFEKFRKMKRDREARAAAEAVTTTAPVAAPAPSISSAPPPALSSAPVPASNLSETPVVPPAQSMAPRKLPRLEEKRPVVLAVKDIISVMSRDSSYAYSPALYSMFL